MTLCDPASLSGDERGLPEEERPVLERARGLIRLIAERAPAAAVRVCSVMGFV
jgi:hypothetical protein